MTPKPLLVLLLLLLLPTVNSFSPCAHSFAALPRLSRPPLLHLGNSDDDFGSSTETILSLDPSLTQQLLASLDPTLNPPSSYLPPASNIAYFWLQQELGLDDQTLFDITMRNPQILGLTVTNLQKKLDVLQALLHLSTSDIVAMIKLQPSVLHLSQSEISLTIKLLLEHMDTPSLKAAVLSYPSILCYSRESLTEKLRFLSTNLALSPSAVSKMCASTPQILTLSHTPFGALAEKFEFFAVTLGLDDVVLGKIAQKHPRIFLYSLDKLLSTVIGFYVGRLHLTVKDVGKLLGSYPQVRRASERMEGSVAMDARFDSIVRSPMCLHSFLLLPPLPQIVDFSLDNTVLPLFFFFTEEMGLEVSDVRMLTIKYPRIVTHGTEKCTTVFGFLRYEMEVRRGEGFRRAKQDRVGLGAASNERADSKHAAPLLAPPSSSLTNSLQYGLEDIKKIVLGFPQIFGLGVDGNVREKLRWLRDERGMSGSEIKKLVRDFPTVLGMGKENIALKLDLLVEQLGKKETRALLGRAPATIGYSAKRVGERLEGVRRLGLGGGEISYLISYTEEKWRVWLRKEEVGQGRKRKGRRAAVSETSSIKLDNGLK